MRLSFFLALSLFVFAGCGTDEADPAAAPAPEEQIVDAAPTFCEEGELVILEEQLGDGAEATRENTVLVNYAGRLEDGTEFDSNESYPLALPQMIPGFREGIAGMKVGGRRQITIPGPMGYGPDGRRDPRTGEYAIPPCATLIFDVDLLEIVQ